MAEIQQEEGEEPVEYFDVRSTGDDAVPEPTGAESFPPHLLSKKFAPVVTHGHARRPEEGRIR
jgi:hypothetical protein